MFTAESARTYVEARIDAIDRIVEPLAEERETLLQLLQFLLQGGLPQGQEPEQEEEDLEPDSPLRNLTRYRRDLFRAMGDTFTRDEMLAWVVARKDHYSTHPGAQAARVTDARYAFYRNRLTHEHPDGTLEKIAQ